MEKREHIKEEKIYRFSHGDINSFITISITSDFFFSVFFSSVKSHFRSVTKLDISGD